MNKLFLIDDHKQITDGLKAYLLNYKEFEVVGVAQTGTQALEMLKTTVADIIVLDIRLPDMTGKTVFEKLGSERPKVLVSSMEAGSYCAKFFISQKVEGYILKESGYDNLVQALTKITQGKTYSASSPRPQRNSEKIRHKNRKNRRCTLYQHDRKIPLRIQCKLHSGIDEIV